MQSTFPFPVIDLKLIRACIDYIFDYLYGPEISINGLTEQALPRNDFFKMEYLEDVLEAEDKEQVIKELKKTEALKAGVTTLVGAMMQKQECWQRAFCIFGDNIKLYPVPKGVFLLAAKQLPAGWQGTVDIVEKSTLDETNNKDACDQLYECDATKDGRELYYY